jgi:hypothetical protein
LLELIQFSYLNPKTEGGEQEKLIPDDLKLQDSFIYCNTQLQDLIV